MTTSTLHAPGAGPLTLVSSVRALPLSRLAGAVIDERPEYAPQVADGTVHLQEWLWAKEPAWRRALLATDGEMVAHVGVRTTREVSDLELCRLMVHPDWQRRGLASHLVGLAVAQFGTRLRVLVGPGTPSHLMFLHHGWDEAGTAVEPGEPGECLLLACITPHARRTR